MRDFLFLSCFLFSCICNNWAAFYILYTYFSMLSVQYYWMALIKWQVNMARTIFFFWFWYCNDFIWTTWWAQGLLPIQNEYNSFHALSFPHWATHSNCPPNTFVQQTQLYFLNHKMHLWFVELVTHSFIHTRIFQSRIFVSEYECGKYMFYD